MVCLYEIFKENRCQAIGWWRLFLSGVPPGDRNAESNNFCTFIDVQKVSIIVTHWKSRARFQLEMFFIRVAPDFSRNRIFVIVLTDQQSPLTIKQSVIYSIWGNLSTPDVYLLCDAVGQRINLTGFSHHNGLRKTVNLFKNSFNFEILS